MLPDMQLIKKMTLTGEEATEALARALAEIVQPGELIALEGNLGAGKSTFARAFVRAALDDPACDVPSPTFTLVQTYGSAPGPQIMHADLYRLRDSDEVYDLGLEEDMGDSVTLIEWPDRMPDDWWQGALSVRLAHVSSVDDGARAVTVSANDPSWRERLQPVFDRQAIG